MRATLKRMISLILIFGLTLGTMVFAETAQTTSAYAPLTYGTEDSDEVRAMQKRLGLLGYFDDYVSGGYWKVTANAVAAFQRAAGLPENGRLASSETLTRLFADDAPMADGGVYEPTPAPTPEPSGVLEFGMKDSDGVRQAQKRLAELGYFSSSVTGNFFDATKTAFEAFQKQAGLKVSGKIIDEETLSELFSESAPSKGASPSATVTPLPTATPKPVITPAPDATPRPALYYGDTSEDIQKMQERLKELKYYESWTNGSYWGDTAKAVEAFQQEAGLTVNGRTASSEMLELLFSENAPVKGGAVAEPPTVSELRFGQSGSVEVRRMQERLRELGYFKDVSTGGYYRMTAEAVAAFQEAAGLPVNGNVASVNTLNALYADDAPVFGTLRPTQTVAPTQTIAPTQTTESAPLYQELKYGTTDSAEVRRMQTRLQELGYLDANPTGGYWSMTASAVKAFLADWGLGGSGRTATAQMQELLFGEDAETDPEEPAQTYTTLTYGMEGSAAIKSMQLRLRELGYFNESATGNYYTVTASAVAAFQTAAGLVLQRDVATPEMQQLLFSANAPAFGQTIAPPAQDDDAAELPELSTDYQPLSYGMSGSDAVRAMQKKLRERGFLKADATGGYYTETRKAVAAFQEYCALPVNGRLASAETLGYLFYTGDLDALIAAQKAEPPMEEDGGSDANPYEDVQLNTLLSKGSMGRQVELLILRLTELGYLKDEAPTEYDEDVVGAVKWFQNTNLLDSDGVAGPLTLKAIYSAEAISADKGMEDNAASGAPVEVEGEEISVSIGSVLNIDWFSEEGAAYYDRRSGLFDDGAVAILTDVSTGRSFRVKRCGGYNHADVEPLTARDTWVMYEIYGKEWSWKRRAVYVTLENGVTLAGSMNGMPHGSGEISDNNFDGHLCVHFLNSRTHESDKVDPDHQAAVAKAAGR